MKRWIELGLLAVGLCLCTWAYAAPEMVRIPGQNYEIGKYEVTLGQWRDIMDHESGTDSNCGECDGGNCPVSFVSWNDIQEYIARLNQKTGKQYRLPSQAEWKYACYGETATRLCGTDSKDEDEEELTGWFRNNTQNRWNGKYYINALHPVGQKRANKFGLYDMDGNVGEFTADCEHNRCTVLGYNINDTSWESGGANLTHEGSLMRIDDPRPYCNYGFRLARSLTNIDEPKKEVPPKPEKKVNKEMAAACKCVFDSCDRLLLTKGNCLDEHDAEYCAAKKAANEERKASVRNAAKPARAEKLKTCKAWKAADPDAASDGYKAKLKQQDEAIAAAEKLADAEYDRKLSAIEAAEKQRIAAKGAAAKAEQQAGKAAQAQREAANAKAAADRKAKDEQHRQWCLADSKRLNLCECAAYAPAGGKTCSK